MITILCVGKIKEKYLVDLIKDYSLRINKYHKLNILELKDSNINEEKNLILKHIRNDDYVFGMDIDGEKIDSEDFAKIIDNSFVHYSNLIFIIGGSDGLHSDVKERCNRLISFSLMTFPHGLFRGILLEQIYRTFKINNNEKYHK